MWRSSKDAFSLSLQKAFSASLPTVNGPEPRASFELSSDQATSRDGDIDAVRARLSSCGLTRAQEQRDGEAAGRKSASYSREELDTYNEWLVCYCCELWCASYCVSRGIVQGRGMGFCT